MDEFQFWKPEPRRRGGAWYSLIVPAVVYVCGVVTYSHGAFVPEAIANSQSIGSALMVIGGEAGTIGAVSEVFRKHLSEEEACGIFDWLGMGISLLATLGNLFVVYATLTTLSVAWVEIVRMYGPFILLLCSGLDSYFSLAEYGFYNASWERRWERWNGQRHAWEQRERARNTAAIATAQAEATRKVPEVAATLAEIVRNVPELPKASVADWRKIAGTLNGETATLTANSIVAVLRRNGFAAPSTRTCRNWVTAARAAHTTEEA